MIEPRALPGNLCTVHGYHYPTPLRTVKHHIVPQEYGGPTTPENLLLVCDNGHYAIHAIQDAMLAGTAIPKGTRKEYAYAQQGALVILAKGLTKDRA